jgi:putative membrane protein
MTGPLQPQRHSLTSVNRASAVWHGLVLAAVIVSALTPADRLTWWLDIAPALLIYGAVSATRHSFPLTPLSHWLLGVLLVAIAIGAHYGFAAVPGFGQMLPGGSERNQFDRLAHFLQGLAPAAVFREVLVRSRIAPKAPWLAILTIALTLALSAAYELVEWSAVMLLGARADDFIAAQGDPWDAQTDMALALAGSATLLLILARVQDRQIAAMAPH